jgi:hypothetical protein
VKNVVELEDCRINTLLGCTSHWMKFRDGGEVKFSYSQLGILLELSFENVCLELTANNEIIFSSRQGIGQPKSA